MIKTFKETCKQKVIDTLLQNEFDKLPYKFK